MNYFIISQLTTKCSFHHNAVFHPDAVSLAVDLNHQPNVPIAFFLAP
jgi:hypothetical protein